MTVIAWEAALESGIPMIDEQHRNIVNLINDLCVCVQTNAHRSGVLESLDRIIADTRHHFETEELLFREYRYPEETSHSALHRSLEAQITAVRETLADRHGPLSDIFLVFLQDWFVNHIRASDRLFALWFRETCGERRETVKPVPE